MKKLSTLLLLCFSCMLHAQIPVTGLLHHYTFDSTLIDASGTDTLRSGTGHYVANRCGVPNTAQSLSATAFTFPQDVIPGLPAGSAPVTIAFWYRSEQNTTHSLFNYGTLAGFVGLVWDNGEIVVSGGSTNLAASRPYSGDWTHVVLTCGQGTGTIYINGVMANSASQFFLNTVPQPSVSRMGHSPFGGEYSGFSMDDLLLYNRAITAQEVSDIYNTGLGANITQPATASPAIACLGDTIHLSVTAIGNNLMYEWKDNGVAIPDGTSAVLQVVPAPAMMHDFTVTITSSCGVKDDTTASVGIFSYPTPTIVATGSELATQGYDTYQWLLNGNEISGANTSTYTATENGTYTVAVTRSGVNCVGVSPPVTLTQVGIEEADGVSTVVYPNPASEQLHIRCDEAIITIEIYNMLGERIRQLPGDTTQIRIADLSTGLYTIRLYTRSGRQIATTFSKK